VTGWRELYGDHFPSHHDGGGVYALYWQGEVVYVGRSKSLRTRVKTHNEWMPFDTIKILRTNDFHEQARREANLIWRLRPAFNQQFPPRRRRGQI
jgi:excinuclease UvrABC nuclease subunit